MPKRKARFGKSIMGARLREVRLEQGLSTTDLSKKIHRDYGRRTSHSTILILENRDVDSGFKTVESVALGLGLDPLEVLALGMEETPKPEGLIKQLAEAYRQVREDKKPIADKFLDMLHVQMEKFSR